MTTPVHTWNFFRAGGFDQVKLTCGADLLNLDQLDQKLWVALACPTTGLEFDSKTLQLIDADNDGRIRARDIIAACRWAGECLTNPDDLLKGSPELPLAEIKEPQLRASAKQILTNLGKANATAITTEDTADTVKIFAATHFNGDGIVPADAAEDGATAAVINEIIACLGSVTDRSGKPGISRAQLDQFFAEANAFSNWHQQADAAVFALGDATTAAAAALRAVKAKVDDYFARCRLAAYDARAVPALNRLETEYLAIAGQDLSATAAEVASFPLARIEAGKSLSLTAGINPAWAEAIAEFRTRVVGPLLGDLPAITEADWHALTGKLAAHEAWRAGKTGGAVEPLGIQRVREILAGNAAVAIAALISKDQAFEPVANSIANIDKLIRYHRDLYLLCTNFVNFQDFYAHANRQPAIFQAGTLYLDQRSCELTLPVDDYSKHALMAGLAGAYLAYCECTRKSTGEKRQIVAAFTDGDSDNLMVGRNGIFYDRQGRDWDATITKIIDNPISLRQSFWAPYKKFVRMIEEQIAKRAAAADAANNAQLQNAAAGSLPPEPPKKIDVGTVAALGVAVGAIGAFLTALSSRVFGIIIVGGPVATIGATLGVMLLISLPSVVLAFIKLRKRNLGPILDANGWAVNAKAKINVPFGAALTDVAKLPPGSHRDIVDPYAERTAGRNRAILLLIIVALVWSAWRYHWPDKYRTWRQRQESKLLTGKAPVEPVAAPQPAN